MFQRGTIEYILCKLSVRDLPSVEKIQYEDVVFKKSLDSPHIKYNSDLEDFVERN